MRHAYVAFLLVSAVSAQETTAPLPSAVIPTVAAKVRRNIDILTLYCDRQRNRRHRRKPTR
jgi:hypothetical protein